MTTNVKNGSWLNATSKSCSTNEQFIVHISAPEIDVVHMEGPGDVKVNRTFDATEASLAIAGSGNVTMIYMAGSIRASIIGSGDLDLNGTCDRQKVSIEGTGNVRATDPGTRDMKVEIAGSGDVIGDTSGDVRVSIADRGDVFLAHAPTHIEKWINGYGTMRIVR